MPTYLRVSGPGEISPGGVPVRDFVRLGGMNGKLLTADEVAAYLRVKRSWVYAETRANRIPHVRLGRYVRYSPDAVERWIADKAQIGARGSDG